MRPFIVIREFKNGDEIPYKELVKEYVMSFAFEAFTSCLFREIFIQLTVLVAAIMFIFLGLPLIICLSAVPMVVILIYVSVYSTYFSKAMELANEPIRICWIAEAYEPYLVQFSTKIQQDYDIVQEERIFTNDLEINRMRRTVIGTITIDTHKTLPNAGWISHLAIKPKNNFDKIAEPLINRVLKHGVDMKMETIETVTTECQFDLRELLLRLGFAMKQIYNRQVLGSNSLRIMKSQMGIDLMSWTITKNK